MFFRCCPHSYIWTCSSSLENMLIIWPPVQRHSLWLQMMSPMKMAKQFCHTFVQREEVATTCPTKFMSKIEIACFSELLLLIRRARNCVHGPHISGLLQANYVHYGLHEVNRLLHVRPACGPSTRQVTTKTLLFSLFMLTNSIGTTFRSFSIMPGT